MIVLYILAGILSVTMTFYFYKGYYKSSSIFSKTLGVILLLFGNWYMLVLPFELQVGGWLTTSLYTLLLFLVLSAYSLVISPSLNTRDDKTGTKYILYPIAFIYTIIYLPYITVYYFRILPLWKLLLFSALTLTIFYGILLLIKIIVIPRVPKKMKGLVFFLAMVFIIGVNIPLLKTNSYTQDNEQVEYQPLNDYYSKNIASISDGAVKGKVEDFHLDDQYVYYLVRDTNSTSSLNNSIPYTFKVYDYKQDVEVFSKTFTSNSAFRKSIIAKESIIYCLFYNEIFSYEDQTFTKEMSLEDSYIRLFTHQNDDYFSSTNKETEAVTYYKITDSINQTFQFDSLENLSVMDYQLVKRYDDRIELIDSESHTTYPLNDDYLVYFTDSRALYRVDDVNLYTNYEYKVIDNLGNESSIHNMGHVVDGEVKQFEDIYYFTYDEFRYPPLSYAFVDEDYNVVASYTYYMFDVDQPTLWRSALKEANGSLVYITQTKYFDEGQELYFEINSLHKTDDISLIPSNEHNTMKSHITINIVSFSITIGSFITHDSIKRKSQKDLTTKEV